MPKKLDLPDEKIVEEYRNGASIRELAKKFKCSSVAIRMRLINKQVKLRRKKKLIELPEEEIAEKYKNGWSLKDLAIKYGCSQITIRTRLVKKGVKIRPPYRRKERRRTKKRIKPKVIKKTPLEVRREEFRKRREALIDFILDVYENMQEKKGAG